MSTYDTIDYDHNKVAVYRHDAHGVLRDVTGLKLFRSMEDLTLIDGEMMHGTYVTDGHRVRTIMTRQHMAMNERMVQQGIINNVDDGESPFEGFTEKDVAVRWLSAFLHLAYKDSTPAHIQTMLHHLAIHDIAGPKFKKDIPASLPIQSPSPKLSALDRLKNYSRDGIDLEKIDGMFCSTFTPSSMNGGQAELDEIFQQMFDEMQNVHTPATDILF